MLQCVTVASQLCYVRYGCGAPRAGHAAAAQLLRGGSPARGSEPGVHQAVLPLWPGQLQRHPLHVSLRARRPPLHHTGNHNYNGTLFMGLSVLAYHLFTTQ
eukprot:1179676-Prorocentrum_minimum.AAC.3